MGVVGFRLITKKEEGVMLDQSSNNDSAAAKAGTANQFRYRDNPLRAKDTEGLEPEHEIELSNVKQISEDDDENGDDDGDDDDDDDGDDHLEGWDVIPSKSRPGQVTYKHKESGRRLKYHPKDERNTISPTSSPKKKTRKKQEKNRDSFDLDNLELGDKEGSESEGGEKDEEKGMADALFEAMLMELSLLDKFGSALLF